MLCFPKAFINVWRCKVVKNEDFCPVDIIFLYYKIDIFICYECIKVNKAFRHVETLFVQGNQVRTDHNKPLFVCLFVLFCSSLFEVCFDQLDYLG